MEYVLGVIAGVIYGGLVGLFKYLFLWRKILNDNCETVSNKMVYVRLIISYIANVVTLLITYFIRDMIPFDFAAFAIATAAALSLAGKFFSIQKAVQKVEI